jgi:hypothetical protein
VATAIAAILTSTLARERDGMCVYDTCHGLALRALQTCAVPHRLLDTSFPHSTGRAYQLCLQFHLSSLCLVIPGLNSWSNILFFGH